MKKYRISVIIPVYNAEEYIHTCIDSLLNQILKDIEIIIVDDGSTDNSAEILDEYAQIYKNIKVIHQTNQGPAVARNVGLENASGEYIGFVDSDDYVANDFYEILYNTAIKNSIDIVISDYYNVIGDVATHCGNFQIPPQQVIDKQGMKSIIAKANESRVLWFSWKGIYKTELIKKSNIIYPVELRLGEETIFCLECFLCASSMYYIDKPFYYYVQTPDSLTRLKYKENLLKQLEDLYFSKKNVYKKYGFNDYVNDLNSYTMKHTLPMLISNEFNHKISFSERIRVYKKIRNSEMIKDAYKTCSTKLIKSKLKYICILLKYRMYYFVDLIMNIK